MWGVAATKATCSSELPKMAVAATAISGDDLRELESGGGRE